MKKLKRLPLLLAAIILLAFAAAFCFASPQSKTYAYGPYDFEFTDFDVTYDVRSDRTMSVTERFTILYKGYSSTGFYRDIPVNAGDRVRNISAYEIINGVQSHLDYGVESEDSDMISLNIGDTTRKTGTEHVYLIKYEYAMTRPADKNVMYLNAIGYGSEGAINDVDITYNLPDGLKPQDVKCYSGRKGSDDQIYDFNMTERADGGTTVSLHLDYLPSYNGVTFSFPFIEGVLSVKTDFTPYWIIIAGCAILAILFAVKFLKFNKDNLTTIINVEAPDEMDPIVMGKLIDNKVDKSDVTSLIYYWADKGYLKINMENPNDVVLLRIMQWLPENAPEHQKYMYAQLFKSGDEVHINSLTNVFYPTVEKVTKTVNTESGKLYDGKSMGVAVFFALIGALIMGLTPIIIAMLTISYKLLIILPLFMVIPSFIIFAATQSVKYGTLKHGKKKTVLLYIVVAILAVVFTLIYLLLVPSFVIETLPKILLCVLGFAIIMISVSIITRTDKYTEKLNKIVGFREFILNAEKDKLETMLEGNPDFYYHVLPYAIVLGVSDIWENKFANLTVAPPSWTYGNNMVDSYVSFAVFNASLRTINNNMLTAFVSRPSSNSLSGGGGHGGSFGGFSGGGHGGGGFRGR